MRNSFRLKAPLAIVDLPQSEFSDYFTLRKAAERSRELSDSLLIVTLERDSPEDEHWARQLGVWAHLSGAVESAGLELVFKEARQALARQALIRAENQHGPMLE
jgi:hypothetical protein